MDSPHFIIIPGLAEAQAEESALREAAFLPVKESICGIEVEGFSPFHYAILSAAGSPFIYGGTPTTIDIAAFLWVVSPQYSPRSRFTRWRFLRRFRSGFDWLAAMDAIRAYVSAALADGPTPSGEGGVSYWSALAGIVDSIASQYHWPEREILRIPFARLFQYQRCIRARVMEKPIFFNARSDAIISEFQRAESAKRAAAQAATN